MLPEPIVFFRECLTQFKNTGSVLPSSPWAAKALTNPLRASDRPQKILEIGPGTGAVTTKILKDMIEGDSLTICEINSRFMKALKQKLSTDKNYLKHRNNITFFEGPVQKMSEDTKFDLIVCAIPFTNLSLPVVEEIFIKLAAISSDETHLTFFQYLALRELGRVVSLKERRERMREIDQFFEALYVKYETSRETVWLNFTPINIFTMKLKRAA